MLDGGSLTPNSSQHVGRCSLVMPCHKRSHHGCLSRPCAQGSAISAFNPLAAQQCVLCRQGFSSSVCQAVAGTTQAFTSKFYQQCWKEWAGWCIQQDVPINAISAPKLANVLLHLFQVGLVWCTIGVYHSAIFTFLQPHWLHKASDHPVISKLMHHFYFWHLSHKHFDSWDVEHSLSLLESWAPAFSLTSFRLAWKTATLLALVTEKHCCDLTLLCIDNQHLFLFSVMLLFSFPVWWKDRLSGSSPPQICIESHTNINLFPIFLFEGLSEMY